MVTDIVLISYLVWIQARHKYSLMELQICKLNEEDFYFWVFHFPDSKQSLIANQNWQSINQGFGINFYKVYNYWFHFTWIWEFYGPRKVEILFLFFRCENFAKKYFRADMFKIEMLTHASSLMQLWLNKERWIKFQKETA